jgi:hypothetical protein
VVNFGTTNNEYLNGPNAAAMILNSTVTLNQSGTTTSEGLITGATLVSNGTINASSNGSNLFIESTNFDNIGTLDVSGGDHVSVLVGFTNTGVVDVTSSSKLSLTTSSNTALSNVTAIDVTSSGSLIVSGSLAGTGDILLSNFGVADMFNTSNTVTFLDGKDTLRLEAPGTFTAAIAGFQKGDKIDLLNTSVTKLSPASTTSSTVLTVDNGATAVATLNFLGDYVGFTFGFTPDGGTGFDITVACFAEGTRILTVAGEVPVEALREGDLLPVQFQQDHQPIKWIGRRHVDCRRHPRPADMWPVRIAAHAFASGQPHRDLWLSPDHAVLVDGVLIPIRLLTNGTSITQVPVDTVTYYHVELPHHDVLLAEGLPVESYLDAGNRTAFANAGGVVALHPDFRPWMWDTEACAPLIVTGPMLDATRDKMNAQAVRTVVSPTARRTTPRRRRKA